MLGLRWWTATYECGTKFVRGVVGKGVGRHCCDCCWELLLLLLLLPAALPLAPVPLAVSSLMRRSSSSSNCGADDPDPANVPDPGDDTLPVRLGPSPPPLPPPPPVVLADNADNKNDEGVVSVPIGCACSITAAMRPDACSSRRRPRPAGSGIRHACGRSRHCPGGGG